MIVLLSIKVVFFVARVFLEDGRMIVDSGFAELDQA